MTVQTSPNTEQPPLFAGVIECVNRVVQVGGAHLAQIVEQSQPTPNLLRAIAEELQRAVVKPRSVPHPELIDPAVYWERALWPQASAVIKASRKLLLEAAEELRPAIAACERELQAWLTHRAFETQHFRAADPEHTRNQIVDEIAMRCEELHHIVEMVGILRPPLDTMEQLQAELDERRLREAAGDVRRIKADFDREHATVDPAAAAAHWEATFGQRVHARDAELRAAVPWRHQDLVIEAHRMVRKRLGLDVNEMIEDLVKPILGIGERLVQFYDQVAAAPV